MLLQQGHQEIHGEVNILHKVVLRHAHVADGDGQAKHLEKKDTIVTNLSIPDNPVLAEVETTITLGFICTSFSGSWV